jgi:LysM repeat protein
MKKLPFLSIYILIAATSFAQSSTVIKDYINKYKQVAIEEMIRTGVPASITLAQGIHETEAGRSKLVLKSNNHFGIKCKSEWRGESVSHDDDARGECFRKYADPADSYKDHSDFLKTRAHYASLFQLDPADYEGWAYGLKKAGYATNPKYPQVLIRLIKDYNLQDYSLVALGRKVMEDEPVNGVVTKNTVANKPAEKGEEPKRSRRNYPEGVFKINRTSVLFVPKGVSYLAIAEEYNISLRRLFEFNDMLETEMTLTDGLVFLQRKRTEGATEFHTVEPGETIYDIAQAEGMRLESLLSYNYLRSDVPPAPGRNLYLKKGDNRPQETVVQIATALPESEKVPVAAGNDYLLHKVEAKQSLYAISKLYEVSVDEIKQWNSLEGNDLKAGQQLRINKK